MYILYSKTKRNGILNKKRNGILTVCTSALLQRAQKIGVALRPVGGSAGALLQVGSFAGTGAGAGGARPRPLPSEAPQPPERRSQARRARRLGGVALGRRRHGRLRDLDRQDARGAGGSARVPVGGHAHGVERAPVGHPEEHAGGQCRGVARGLRRHRREKRRARRRIGLGDGEAAERAGSVGREPRVDALSVEAVAAAGQEPRRLAVLELREAHGALHRALLRLLGTRRRRAVHRDGQRAQQLRVDAPGSGPDPTITTATAPPPPRARRVFLAPPSVPGVEAVLERDEDEGEDDEEQEDPRHGEDAAELHGTRRGRHGRRGGVIGGAGAAARLRRARGPGGALVGVLRHAARPN
ncbi:hypothetical protein GQ55_1G266300 [Panicum hallii var. hallii]|uniref:Uncharacterized protein n=1 Tax=Panicum hallii var. hallii TaxID=1504633 RepID=A0A2T7F7U4_9POAL|nr:hypothetical protein GQ55_1G266300 [Panicum hallii var. hallii]